MAHAGHPPGGSAAHDAERSTYAQYAESALVPGVPAQILQGIAGGDPVAAAAGAKVAIAPWSENRQDDAARLIASAYSGRVVNATSTISTDRRAGRAVFLPISCSTPAAARFSRRPHA